MYNINIYIGKKEGGVFTVSTGGDDFMEGWLKTDVAGYFILIIIFFNCKIYIIIYLIMIYCNHKFQKPKQTKKRIKPFPFKHQVVRQSPIIKHEVLRERSVSFGKIGFKKK